MPPRYAGGIAMQETFCPGGKPPAAGEKIVLPDHARTLQRIAETSGEAFYRGELAQRIGVPVHRVTYLIRARGIDHAAEAAGARVFDADAERRLRYELKLVEARRHSGHAYLRRHAKGASNG